VIGGLNRDAQRINDAFASGKIKAFRVLAPEISRVSPSCAIFARSSWRNRPAKETLRHAFYSAARHDNRHRSHCCRKMVGIAAQGELIASGATAAEGRRIA
jgi:hypothetical protein